MLFPLVIRCVSVKSYFEKMNVSLNVIEVIEYQWWWNRYGLPDFQIDNLINWWRYITDLVVYMSQ